MTDHELEQRLRNWYRAEIRETEQAPAALRASVAGIPRPRSVAQRRMPWRFSRATSMRFAVAAAIGVLAVGGAFYALAPRVPVDVGPSQTPGLNASPNATARAAAWTSTGTMVAPREGHTATLLRDGRVLVAGGSPTGQPGMGGRLIASAELYDPASRTWTATGSMIEARYGHTATLLPDGRVLVAGGFDGAGRSVSLAELYDPASGTWTATSATTALTAHTATLLPDGRVLVAGGFDAAGREVASAELYDPASGTWTATGSMATPRIGHTATLLPDGRVLVAGGGDNGASAELYDPASGTWTVTGSMATARIGHTATLLADGRVLVAGGGGGLGTGSCCGPSPHANFPTAELYDPTSGTWTSTRDMLYAQGGSVWTANGGLMYLSGGHTATLLSNGEVLVTGGSPSGAVAELYDPASGSWTRTSNMIEVHAGGTATLLPDGTVLVVGGDNADVYRTEITGAELYDPTGGN